MVFESSWKRKFMKKVENRYVGLLLGAAGLAFVSAMLVESKWQKRVESQADHVIDRRVLATALNEIHRENLALTGQAKPDFSKYLMRPGPTPMKAPARSFVALLDRAHDELSEAREEVATSQIKSSGSLAHAEINLLRAIQQVDRARAQFNSVVGSRSVLAGVH
jgi:hypothetical protein